MDDLTEKQEDELKGDLLKLRTELAEALAASGAEAAPVDLDLPIGRISRMDAIQQQSLAKASKAANERRLALAGAALALLEEGEYGLCRDCGEPIGYARLKAKPETPFCLECQGSREARN